MNQIEPCLRESKAVSLFVCLSIRLSFYLSICLLGSLSLCLSSSLSLSLSPSLSLKLSTVPSNLSDEPSFPSSPSTHHSLPSSQFSNFFSECLARVPVSLWGSGAWGCVRSTWCLQPSTTVLNRPGAVAWGPYGRAHGKFCEMWSLLESFGGFRCFFRRRVASFHLAWHFVTFRCVS